MSTQTWNTHSSEFRPYMNDVDVVRQDVGRFTVYGVDHEFGQKLVDADYEGVTDD